MKTNQMFKSPVGWFKAATLARDTESMFRELVKNNNNRVARGLPPFEPSYELARAAVLAGNGGAQ